MFERVSLSEMASFLGICIGFAFAVYVVRTIGYFSIVGPELLGLFLDYNLISGAVTILPIVTVWLSLGVFSFYWLAMGWSYLSEKYPNNIIFDGEIRGLLFGLITALILLIIIAIGFFSEDLAKGSKIVSSFAILIINASLAYTWRTQRSFYSFSILFFATVSLYHFLIETGKLEARLDLNGMGNRYSIVAEDKSYVNVAVLKTTSNSILLKVGDEIVLYDRSRIKRIDRSSQEAKKKDV